MKDKKKGKARAMPPEKAGDLEIVGVVPTTSLYGKMAMRQKPSKYRPLIEKCVALEQGQTLEIRVPEGEDPGVFRNNISAAVKRKYLTDHRSRGRIRFALTNRGTLAISCTPN